jgi:hypothetical protein
MNWLKNGPELKKPDLKVPPFVADLYYDLRERRLLPILALAVVAIVAVPILLGGGSEEEEEAGSTGAAGAIAGASGTQASHFTVVESKPGLRDYRKRLARRSPTDPFKQRFTGQELKQAELNPETGEESVSIPVEGGSSISPEETVSPTPEESGGDSGGGSPGGSPQNGDGGGGNPEPGDLVFFSWAVDVKITKSGGGGAAAERRADGPAVANAEDGVTVRSPVELASDPEPTIRHKVLPLTRLPGDKQPVATYMGRSPHGLPLFLVSSKVKSVFGESKCVSGDDSCQLIEVEPKFPITFVYGPNEVRYTFNVLKIELVVTGHD